MNIIKQLLVLLIMLVSPAYAMAGEEVEDPGYYAEIQLLAKSQDVFAQSLYAQKSVNEQSSVYLYGYHENGFREAFIGIARQMGDFQVGIGAGTAQYDATNHAAINLWLDYESGPYSASLEYEHYSREIEDPVFLRGHFQKNVLENVSLGIYGETGFGVGPMIGFNTKSGNQVRIMRSLAGRQEGGALWILEFTMTFE